MAHYGTFSKQSDVEAQRLNESNHSVIFCPICYEDYQHKSVSDLQPCHHQICTNCMKTISDRAINLGIEVTCPICRSEVQNWPQYSNFFTRLRQRYGGRALRVFREIREDREIREFAKFMFFAIILIVVLLLFLVLLYKISPPSGCLNC